METESKRPSATLINKEWYAAAKSVLNSAQLGQLLIKACEYVFAGGDSVVHDTFVTMAFAMVKPALDSDIAKYAERCARNASNARSQSQRVGASGSQSQRVGANTTTTSTSNTTTTSTSNPSISQDEQRKRERFIIYGYFWSVGSGDPMAEMNAFWDYYESLGWKNNKGAVIVSKQSAARMWRRQYETKTPPAGAQAWFKAVQTCKILDQTAFTIFAGSEIDDGKVIIRLRCTNHYLSQLREYTPRLEADLRASWRGLEPVFETAG